MRAAQAIVCAAALFLGAGCGAEEELDADKVERFIRSTALRPELLRSIECPEGRPLEKGDQFDCAIEARDGSAEVVTVRQTDDDGSIQIAGNRQTRLGAQREIRPANIEAFIRETADIQRPNRSVTCPEGVPIEQGRSFSCTAVAVDGTRETVDLREVDALGNVRIAGVRPR